MPQLTQSPTLWLQAIALVFALCLVALREQLQDGFDVVHAQWIIPSGLVAKLLHAVSGVPYLITAQGADAFRLDHLLLRWIKRWIINNSTRFIAVSSDIAAHIDGVTVPVEVQPSGIDFSLWAQLVGRRQPERGKVLFVGRLATKKGVADAITAVARIENAHLVIVGDGPLRNQLRRLSSELQVMNRVKFLGSRSRAEIAEQMRTASCIVIPSITADDGDRDGTPNVLGEAVAAGVPVIGSRIAGIGEYLIDGRSGLLFSPGDVDGLRDQLRNILAAHDLDLMTQTATKALRVVLDIGLVSDRYAGWYRSAAALRRGQ